ncbi:hypothetical protein F5J12DRAFT_840025 [Pisolithus orientalis]|uniref:uncharacterized protein n=1 Tax=Pisolithus orientalis TaxID=936130 RepID=UPI0022245DAB|nr:uncharacterized protein F5J12DRAFT_840025 [Pisolithus orientalis]KAI6002597.1 hypothetical protein F5J12DRAFT_840025 [Pisolithus orientalis]
MWTLLYGVDALPDVGLWATVGFPRALDVIDRGNGTFVMCTGHLFPSSHQMLTYFHADYAAESPSQDTLRWICDFNKPCGSLHTTGSTHCLPDTVR